MKIIVSTFFYSNYRELAERTVYQNLFKYCILNKYWFMPFSLTDEIDPDPYKMACQACFKNSELILKTLEDHPEVDYVFHRDCDSVIMDMGKRLETIIEAYPYDIVTGSDKAGVSAGQMIVKNTEQTKNYLREFLEHKQSYEHEQDFFAKNPRPFLFATPQNVMNSYDTVARLEGDEAPGNFKDGDFILHMAGMNLSQKMGRLDYWMGKAK